MTRGARDRERRRRAANIIDWHVEKAGRNVRDGYAAEHMKISSHQRPERVARRAGAGRRLPSPARATRRFAQSLEGCWDKAADLSLEEAGVTG